MEAEEDNHRRQLIDEFRRRFGEHIPLIRREEVKGLSLTGQGKPLLRGVVCGLMTTAGGIGHTLPYLIPDFRTATAVAVVIVAIELLLISWIRNRYMDTPFLRAAFQVIVGGVLVFLVGIWIGSS